MATKKITDTQKETVLNFLLEKHGDGADISRQDIQDAADACEVTFSQTRFLRNPSTRVGRGVFKLPSTGNGNGSAPAKAEKPSKVEKPAKVTKNVSSKAETMAASENYVPVRDPNYVKFGDYNKIKTIIKTKKFFPLVVTGLSGNGKTLMLHEICAELKRELIRCNVTIETDEDDLLGGFRLQDGETVFHYGPVVEAMVRGAVLLLDEYDLGGTKMLCLQPVLEGKGIYLKKINKYIYPAKGFTVVATANTKGQGSDDGQFVGTNVQNEAFLERFTLTFEQDYPSIKVETKILNKVLEANGTPDEDYVGKLTLWADTIRQTAKAGGVDAVITTRRLVNIANTFSIFNDRFLAIELCVNRFDDQVKADFISLYEKVSADEPVVEDVDEEVDKSEDNMTDEEKDAAEVPF